MGAPPVQDFQMTFARGMEPRANPRGNVNIGRGGMPNRRAVDDRNLQGTQDALADISDSILAGSKWSPRPTVLPSSGSDSGNSPSTMPCTP